MRVTGNRGLRTWPSPAGGLRGEVPAHLRWFLHDPTRIVGFASAESFLRASWSASPLLFALSLRRLGRDNEVPAQGRRFLHDATKTVGFASARSSPRASDSAFPQLLAPLSSQVGAQRPSPPTSLPRCAASHTRRRLMHPLLTRTPAADSHNRRRLARPLPSRSTGGPCVARVYLGQRLGEGCAGFVDSVFGECAVAHDEQILVGGRFHLTVLGETVDADLAFL